MSVEPGTVYWITGLSGAGKTTIACVLYQKLRQLKPNVVYLDGDTLRAVFGNDKGHSPEDRRSLALSYSRLCKMLAEQGIEVVCATISLFREVHEQNRQGIENYIEVSVDCELEELQRRDQKGLYSKAARGEIRNVMGVDLPYEKPESPDLIIDNTEPGSLEEKVAKILALKPRSVLEGGSPAGKEKRITV